MKLICLFSFLWFAQTIICLVFKTDIELCRSFFSCGLAIILIGGNLLLVLSLIGSIFHFYMNPVRETNEIPLNNNLP